MTIRAHVYWIVRFRSFSRTLPRGRDGLKRAWFDSGALAQIYWSFSRRKLVRTAW